MHDLTDPRAMTADERANVLREVDALLSRHTTGPVHQTYTAYRAAIVSASETAVCLGRDVRYNIHVVYERNRWGYVGFVRIMRNGLLLAHQGFSGRNRQTDTCRVALGVCLERVRHIRRKGLLT